MLYANFDRNPTFSWTLYISIIFGKDGNLQQLLHEYRGELISLPLKQMVDGGGCLSPQKYVYGRDSKNQQKILQIYLIPDCNWYKKRIYITQLVIGPKYAS